MDLNLDEAEAAFLQDILSGTEKAAAAAHAENGAPGAYHGSGCIGPTGSTSSPTACAGSTGCRGQLQRCPSDLSTVGAAASAAGRPPRPRTPSLTPCSITALASDTSIGHLLPSWTNAKPLSPRHLPSHQEVQQPAPDNGVTVPEPVMRGGAPPRDANAASRRSTTSTDSAESGKGYGGRASTAGAWVIPADRPVEKANVASCGTAPAGLPRSSRLTPEAAATSISSGSGLVSPAAGAARRTLPSRGVPSPAPASTRPSGVSQPAPPPAAPAAIGRPVPSSSAPPAPSRRARSLLDQIRALETQLQQLLQAEAETAAAPRPRSNPAATTEQTAALGPEVWQPHAQPHPQQRSHPIHHHPHRQALVFEVAEQLCRDYNTSGVALLEAGLDEGAREQLDKALLLAGPGGPLEGRPDKQMEMQIVAHNNLACYHRKMHQADRALEHLQLAARLESNVAAATTAEAMDVDTATVTAAEPAATGAAGLHVTCPDGAADWPVGVPGPTAATLLNLAACCGSLGQHGQALVYAAQAVTAAARELQVPSLPALEAALLQGLPQAQLCDAVPQLRRAGSGPGSGSGAGSGSGSGLGSGAVTQLAMAYYNRAVEQEHMQLWRPALESYGLAVDMAGRFVGRGADLTLTMQQSLEAFRLRVRRLERQGKLRPLATSPATSLTSGKAASAPTGVTAATPAAVPSPSASSTCSSSTTGRQVPPRPAIRSLRCASTASSASTPSASYAPASTAVSVPLLHQRRRHSSGLPSIPRLGPAGHTELNGAKSAAAPAGPPVAGAGATRMPPARALSARTYTPDPAAAAAPILSAPPPEPPIPPRTAWPRQQHHQHQPAGNGCGVQGYTHPGSGCGIEEGGPATQAGRSSPPGQHSPPRPLAPSASRGGCEAVRRLDAAYGPGASEVSEQQQQQQQQGAPAAPTLLEAPRRLVSAGHGDGNGAVAAGTVMSGALGSQVAGKNRTAAAEAAGVRPNGHGEGGVRAVAADGERRGSRTKPRRASEMCAKGGESLAAVAAAAAAAAAELAQVCGAEEGIGAAMTSSVAQSGWAVGSGQTEDVGLQVVGDVCCATAEHVSEVPPSLSATVDGEEGRGAASNGRPGGRARAGSGVQPRPGSRSVLVPKRDGVTV